MTASLIQDFPPVPLLSGDADVPLDLAEAFTPVYDAGTYALLIDYSRPPEVPLLAELRAWAETRAQG